MPNYSNLYIILISLLLSAFFSGMEIAFIKADKLEIELRNKQGTIAGKIFSHFSHRPSWFISTILIGNNISLVVYGIFMTILLEPYLVQLLPDYMNSNITILMLQTIIATLIVLLTAEFLPKSLFLLNPNGMLSFFAIPIYIIYIILYPAIFLIVKLSKLMIVKILRLDYSEDKPVFGLTDLNEYVRKITAQQGKTENLEVDTKIFSNALEFKTVKVRECLVPRTELVTVDVDDSIEDLRKTFIESGHSKIIVYNKTIDDVIGFCISLDMFKKPKKISDIINPVTLVPETLPANELMVQFITERKSIALVVDEFGGTSGIVTIEDIIEEIFGEIQDEHDEEGLTEKEIDKNTWLLSTRHEIDYLNEKYDWDLPTGDYDTLSGLILSITEDFPKIDDRIEIPPYTLIVTSIQNNRLNLVHLNYNFKEKSGKN